MESAYIAIIFLSLLSCITMLLGALLAILIRENRRMLAMGAGFSAGIMIVISAVELIPESTAAVGTRATLLAAALGAVVLWIAHIILPHTHFMREGGAG